MGALAERLHGDGCQPGSDCFLELPRVSPSPAQRFERVQGDLAVTFALQDDPVVVPAWQQLPTEREVFKGQPLYVRSRVQQPLRDAIGFTQVDNDTSGEVQVVSVSTNEVYTCHA